MDKLGKPIFAEFIPGAFQTGLDAVLTVFTTGEIFLIPVDKDPANYRMNPFREAKPWYDKTQACGSEEAMLLRSLFEQDHVACNSSLTPSCVATFQPPEDIEMIAIEYKKDYLIVKGAMYKKLLSILVFKNFGNGVFKQVMAESLLSVADITYCSYYSSLLVIPRSSGTAITLIPETETIPEHFQHRMIKEMIFAGNNLRRTVHASGGGLMKWHAVTWSDDPCPVLIWWGFSTPSDQEKSWEAEICSVLSQCFIHDVQIDENSNRIGFLMERNGETAICMWEFVDGEIKQYNYIVHGIGKIISARWTHAITSAETLYAVSADTGYYEHQREKVMLWDDPKFTLNTVCRDRDDNALYFGRDAELRIITPNEFYEGMAIENAKIKKLPPLPMTRSHVTGVCDTLSCLHLYRCGNCNRPLLYPLVSSSDSQGLENCYCSAECQAEQWPLFYAIHTDLELGLE